MFTFFFNLINSRRQKKLSPLVIDALFNGSVFNSLSLLNLNSYQDKIPLKIDHIHFDEKTLVYSAFLKTLYTDKPFSFSFVVHFIDYKYNHISLIDTSNANNTLTLALTKSSKQVADFLFHGVKNDLASKVPLSTKEAKAETHISPAILDALRDPSQKRFERVANPFPSTKRTRLSSSSNNNELENLLLNNSIQSSVSLSLSSDDSSFYTSNYSE